MNMGNLNDLVGNNSTPIGGASSLAPPSGPRAEAIAAVKSATIGQAPPAVKAGCGLKSNSQAYVGSKVVGAEGFKQSILNSLGHAASFFTKK